MKGKGERREGIVLTFIRERGSGDRIRIDKSNYYELLSCFHPHDHALERFCVGMQRKKAQRGIQGGKKLK